MACSEVMSHYTGSTPRDSAERARKAFTQSHFPPTRLTKLDERVGMVQSVGSTSTWVRIDDAPRIPDLDLQKKLAETSIRGDIDAVEFLVYRGADPNYNSQSGITMRPPVYYACRYGHYELLKRMVERHHCNAYYITPRGTTLLHLACLHGHERIVQYLTTVRGLHPSARNKHGSTPLHLACVGGHPEIVEYLIEKLHCNPRCIGDLEETPLHTACTNGHLGIMRYLITVHQCNPSLPTKMGETPLHLACQHGHQDIVQYLISEKHCSLTARNHCNCTPLHCAAQHNHPDIVRYLILECKCDPNCYSRDNCTPLHLACRYGRIEVVRVLLAEAGVSPSLPGPRGQTPIQLAYEYEVVKLLIQYGANPQEAQINLFPNIPKKQMENIVRMMVIGDPTTGKSTLVEALQTQPSRLSFWTPPKIINDVKPCTAGIVPYELPDSEFGHVVLYDFAGQHEYYSSHAVVIESAMNSIPPIFIVVVDLSREEEKILRRLYYWISFIENNRPTFVSKPHIVIIGSHLDLIQKQLDQNTCRMKLEKVKRFARDHIKTLQFAGFFALNCKKPASHVELRACLNKSCQFLRQHVQDDSLCHAFYVFLCAYFRGRITCSVREVAEVVKMTKQPFPIVAERLCELCEHLSNKVCIMFLRDKRNIAESSIILDVSTLLSKIQGKLFAPRNFKERKFSNRSGIVAYSHLKEVFQDINPRVITQFMQQLEFCQEIQDGNVLDLVRGRQQGSTELDLDVCEADGHPENQFYFFPALLELAKPDNIWKRDPKFSYYTGWSLQCGKDMDCFPPRFHQTLLLRLSFSFAVAKQEVLSAQQSIGRECTLWTTGIHWLDLNGIETLVEVVEDGQVIVMAMRCLRGQELQCVKLRAAVISKILETKAMYAEHIKTHELLIDSRYLLSYPLPSIRHMSVPVYSMTMLARAVSEEKRFIFSTNQQEFQHLQDFLFWDPYLNLGEGLLGELCDPSRQETPLTEDFLYRFAQKAAESWEHLGKGVFNLSRPTLETIRRQNTTSREDLMCMQVLQEFRQQEETMTISSLRNELDRFSIFQGRNVLVSAFSCLMYLMCMVVIDSPLLVHCESTNTIGEASHCKSGVM